MRAKKADMPFNAATYFLALAFQAPLWLFGGLLWAALMSVLTGRHPLDDLIGGLGWGFLMLITNGNLFAVGFAWRREAIFSAPDREELLYALERACGKSNFKFLTKTDDEVVIVPKWVLFRFRSQESRFVFGDDTAVLRSPALFFRRIRKALKRELLEAYSEENQDW